jgi:hypothetical protein
VLDAQNEGDCRLKAKKEYLGLTCPERVIQRQFQAGLPLLKRVFAMKCPFFASFGGKQMNN